MKPRRVIPLFALLAVGSACVPVDHATLAGAPAYVHGVGAIDRAIAQAGEERGLLRAGWGRVVISTREGGPLAGFERADRARVGVRDRAYVRAIALSTGSRPIVHFAADLLAIDPQTARAVRERLSDRVRGDDIFFSATHTHSGPGGYVRGFPWEGLFGDFEESAFEAIVRAHVEAAELALGSMGLAKIGTATVRVPGVAYNRVERGGPTDDALLVVSLEKLESGQRAALWVFGCHAVTLGSDNRELSGDFPAAVAQRFEGRELDLMAFSAGGLGGADPVDPHPDQTADRLDGPLRRALGLARKSAKKQVRLRHAAVELPSPTVRYQIGSGLMVWPPLAEAVVEPHMSMQLWSVDGLALLYLPVEMSGELTREIRADMRRRGFELGIVAFNGDYLGYVSPRRIFELPETARGPVYDNEVRTASFLGPSGADYVSNLAVRLSLGLGLPREPAAH